MNIITLTAENVKKLRAVFITPRQAGATIISGRNAQGKSTVLDSIVYALRGGRTLPDLPIRDGETRAQIVISMNGITVTRKFSQTGTSLVITDDLGHRIPSPQAALDQLLGRSSLAFDPVEFATNESLQYPTLARLAGIDTSAVDAEIAELFDARREAKAIADRAGKIASSVAYNPDAVDPDTLPDASEEFEAITAHNSSVSRLEEAQAQVMREIANVQKQISDNERAILTLQADAARLSERLATLRVSVEMQPRIPERRDPSDAMRLSRARDAALSAWNKNAEAKRRLDEAASLTSAVERATSDLEQARARRDRLIRGATLPGGLSITPDGAVLLNGLPFAQASTSERIKISLAIAVSLLPEDGLRLILIRDGSQLDESSLATVDEMATATNVQVIIERVGTLDQGAIVIEDGEVLR
jgi:hypothetical protein